MMWGLVPYFITEIANMRQLNARAETVEKLPLFRAPFAKRRCLIPATGFFEWQERADSSAMTFTLSPSGAFGSSLASRGRTAAQTTSCQRQSSSGPQTIRSGSA